jgi:hypothetical protein
MGMVTSYGRKPARLLAPLRGLTSRRLCGFAKPRRNAALGLAPRADELIVVTLPDEHAAWLEKGSADTALDRFSLPVTHLVVEH